MKSRRGPEIGNAFDSALLLGDVAAASWVWFAFFAFTAATAPSCSRVLAPAVVTALVAWVLGTHRIPAGARSARPIRIVLLALAVATAGYVASALKWIPLSGKQALWLGTATAVTLWVMRSVYRRLDGGPARRFWEMVRWVSIGVAATLVMVPFYHAGSLGAGDAHWYVLMLSDFLAQVKAGVFPVWVGQSPYAFNGAVSPLRYAPGFQHYGAFVDFLTASTLQPTVIKNLCLTLSAIGGAFSAYACLRPITAGRPWVACLLAVLWICGPGVLAPVMSGDQYMTFIALPFVPVVLHGCWRVLALDDLWGRLWIPAGLAGLWVCHSPIALWLTLIASVIYLPVLFFRREWRLERVRIPAMAAIFIAMGSLPFISLLNLDNQIRVPSVGLAAAEEIALFFPGNFKPISRTAGGIADYQIGYSLLGALCLSLCLMAVARPKGAWAFAAASLLVIPFTVPVPHVTEALWGHLPGWFVTINNVWPMQRLFLVWSSLVVFFAAIVLGSERVTAPRWRRAFVAVALACGLCWSASEAHKLEAKTMLTHSSPEQTRILEGPNNTALGRYAYSSYSATPGYASHGYMDGWFENRLLDPKTLEPFLVNSEAAAPGDKADAGISTLVSKGTFTAENITRSSYYFLRPTLVLEPGKRYALRLEFAEEGISGTLQLLQDTLFREYLLPDSGAGMDRRGPPRAFGTAKTSGRVIPLAVSGPVPVPIKQLLITPRPNFDDFVAAKYWLYTYERDHLPIVVESWIPYRVHFDSPRPAFLESPRMWLKDWRATVNGHPAPTQRSAENLVMVPVEPGQNTVTLEYHAPVALRISYFLFAASWLAAGGLALAWLFNGQNRQVMPQPPF